MAEESYICNGFVHNPTVSTSTAGDGSNPPPAKKKRNLPGNPDPEAEVIALSPKTLMATNRFLCEICGKGFQRDQNLQLHRRGHNLPWKLKQRSTKEPKKRVYVCPEKTCVHNHPSRALGDLTGIKKHFCRKHGEKKWKCEKCSKRYAVQSDWKAHSKTCGTREYRCDCGTLFSRRDSFITHRAFCDALAEETARVNAVSNINSTNILTGNINNYHFIGRSTPQGPPSISQHFVFKPISENVHQPTSNMSTQTSTILSLPLWMSQGPQDHDRSSIMPNHPLGSSVSSSPATLFGDPLLVSCSNPQTCSDNNNQMNWVYGNKIIGASSSSTTHGELATTPLPSSNVNNKETTFGSQVLVSIPSLYSRQHQNAHQNIISSANMSATALLQKAAQIGATSTDSSFLGNLGLKCNVSNIQVQEDQQNKFCGFYSTSNQISTGQVSSNNINVEKAEGDYSFQMYSQAKTRQLQSDHQETSTGGGKTRDFLGVGQVQTICGHPSSINGWI